MKIYTKTGDDGSTGLLGSGRVQKNHIRIEAYGAVDETNAAIGCALASLSPSAHAASGWIIAIQNDLFILGTLLSTANGTTPTLTLPAERIETLEQIIDQMEEELPALKNFILPQGSHACALLHLARTICRRAERRIVALMSEEKIDTTILVYVNRLSDFLFVLARWVNLKDGSGETAWIPTKEGAGTVPPNTDRLSASLKKLEEDKKRRGSLFEQTAAELQKKKEKADKLFSQGIDKIQREGGKVEKDVRPIDLD